MPVRTTEYTDTDVTASAEGGNNIKEKIPKIAPGPGAGGQDRTVSDRREKESHQCKHHAAVFPP
jgi:hypothetical protein